MPRRAWFFAIGLAVAAMALTIAVGNRFLPARAVDVFRDYLTFGLVGGALGGAGGWLLGRGGSAPARGIVATVSLLAATMITGGVLLMINMTADGSPGAEHLAKVVKKSRFSYQNHYREDNSLKNTVSVQSWLDDDGKLIEVHVATLALWDKLAPGDTIAVTVHDGALGWPWVSTYAPK